MSYHSQKKVLKLAKILMKNYPTEKIKLNSILIIITYNNKIKKIFEFD